MIACHRNGTSETSKMCYATSRAHKDSPAQEEKVRRPASRRVAQVLQQAAEPIFANDVDIGSRLRRRGGARQRQVVLRLMGAQFVVKVGVRKHQVTQMFLANDDEMVECPLSQFPCRLIC